MERIGAGVLIRSNGNEDFTVMMNGIASQEWKRMSAKYEAQRKEFEKEMERMTMINKHRKEQRWRELEEKYNTVEPEPSALERVKEKIAIFLACFIYCAEACHLIKYVGGK